MDYMSHSVSVFVDPAHITLITAHAPSQLPSQRPSLLCYWDRGELWGQRAGTVPQNRSSSLPQLSASLDLEPHLHLQTNAAGLSGLSLKKNLYAFIPGAANQPTLCLLAFSRRATVQKS